MERVQLKTKHGIVDILLEEDGTVCIWNPGRTKVMIPFIRKGRKGELRYVPYQAAQRFTVEVATPGMFGGPEIILIDEQRTFFDLPYALMVDTSKGFSPKVLAQDGVGSWKQQFEFK